jgi:peroxiredoxin
MVKKGNLRTILALFTTAALGIFVFAGDAQKPAAGDAQKSEEAIKDAADFTLNDANGNTVQLSSFKGKKIVVLEWANYDCPFFKAHYDKEVPTSVELIRKYKDKDVVWLTINSTYYATAEAAKAWAEGHKLPQPVLMDTDGKVGKLFGAKTTPHLFVIDKQGKLVYQGAIDNAPLGKTAEGEAYVNYVDNALDELTLGKAVSIHATKPYGCSVKYPPKPEKTE